MKIKSDITLFAGEEPEISYRTSAAKNAEKDIKDRKTVFAGNLNGTDTLTERIRQRKEKARQEAVKLVKDTWDTSKSVDKELDNSREHIRLMQDENLQFQNDLKEVAQKREELMDYYGVTKNTPLSSQPEEYREWMQDLADREEYDLNSLSKNERTIMAENALIRGTRLDRLKKAPMVKTQEEAEKIMESAGEDILGMALDEAKQSIDEKQEEREEKAEKIREEKEKQEELQEKQNESPRAPQNLSEDVNTDEMLDLDRTKEDIRREVQSLLDRLSLIDEDIKGSAVDEII